MDWIGRLLGGTRAQLLRLLRRSRRSINELAAGLGITDNAVRTHIASMQRDGMVRSAGVERGTGGKPAQLYEITPEAEEMFPKAYGTILNLLLDLLQERIGPEEVRELLREAGIRAAGVAPPDGSEEERVQLAADVLRRLGGDVEVERVPEGWRIRGFGCPLSGVVREHEEACSLAESLVERVSGLPARECCERGERPRCSFLIEAA
ncbi:MAG TPA: ArsR family transcriptional regulator [Longimicrobiaceae bacterium]